MDDIIVERPGGTLTCKYDIIMVSLVACTLMMLL